MLAFALIATLCFLPALECAKATVSCRDKALDVYFVADISRSINDTELDYQRNAIKYMIRFLDISDVGIRVGVISYDDEASHIFALENYTSYKMVKRLKGDLVPRRTIKAGTYVDLALDMVAERFSEEGRKGVPQVAIVFTDGRSSTPGRTAVSANIIHKTTNITVVAIGVGVDANREELNVIASGNTGDNVIISQGYEEMKKKVAKSMVDYACQAAEKDHERATCKAICLRNGKVTGGRKAGDNVEFTCDPGYKLNGISPATCKDDGQWSYGKDEPTCSKEVMCPDLVGVEGGEVNYYIKNVKNKFQGVAVYTCDKGYALTTDYNEVVCRSWEKWSAALPTCRYVKCPSFRGIAGGSVSETDATSTTPQYVTFTCDTGYRREGSAMLGCVDGKWNGTAPQCKQGVCGVIRQFQHGRVDYTFKKKDATARFSCVAGYTLYGSEEAQCVDGAWADIPECRKSPCQSVYGIRNGKVSAKGQSLNFECRKGYVLEGATTITCEKSGAYDAAVPSCRKLQCPVITLLRRGAIKGAGDNAPGAVVSFTCQKGYVLRGSATLECGEDEKWSGSVPTCELTRCNNIYRISNGYAVGSAVEEGSTRTFACDKGYTLEGPAAITCTNRRWIPSLPKCVENMCPPIQNFDNGKVKSSNNIFAVGDTVTVSCKPDFVLGGPSTVTCLPTKKWSQMPVCTREESTCDPLIRIENGELAGSNYTVGSKLTVTCDRGYVIKGSATVTCQSNRDWSTLPTCEPNGCIPINIIDHGRIIGKSYFVGDNLTIACQTGYRPMKESVITCKENRQWSSTPSCVQHMCPIIEPFKWGNVERFSRLPGSVIRFKCDVGFKVEGSSTSTCQDDLTWSHPSPKCTRPATCKHWCLPRGWITYTDGPSGKRNAHFSCNKDMSLVGNATATCKNGAWSSPMPSCVPSIPVECRSKTQDLIFVVDISRAVSDEDLEYIRQVIVDVPDHMVYARVGVITFSKDVVTEYSIEEIDSIAKLQLTKVVNRTEKYKDADLVGALEVLSESYDPVKVKRPRKAVIITASPADDDKALEKAAKSVHDSNAQVFVIALGDNYDEDQLKTMATGDGDETIYYADNARVVVEDVREIALQLCTMHVIG